MDTAYRKAIREDIAVIDKFFSYLLISAGSYDEVGNHFRTKKQLQR